MPCRRAERGPGGDSYLMWRSCDNVGLHRDDLMGMDAGMPGCRAATIKRQTFLLPQVDPFMIPS